MVSCCNDVTSDGFEHGFKRCSLMHMQMIDCLVAFNFNSQESFMVWQSPLQGMMLVEATSLQ